MKTIVFNGNAHQKVTSPGEEFSNQVDRITHSEDNKTFSPAILITALEPMSKVTMVAEDRSYAWAQQHGLPLTKVDLTIASATCQICQQQRPTH